MHACLAQVKLLRQKFGEALGPEAAKLVDINTIDGFQGREKDVAIFSAVRSKVHCRAASSNGARMAVPAGLSYQTLHAA